MESPDGTSLLIGSGLEDGTYSIELAGFSGEELFGSWKMWIEDTYGDGGHQATNISITFNKQIAIPEWLSVSPVTGTINPDESEEITVSLDATLLEVGNYFGNINIISNDPDQAEIDIPVELTVDEASSIVENISVNNYSVYPNPFTESTTICIPKSIKNPLVTIYNSQGRVVRIIDRNNSLNYIWDGMNSYGVKVEKGIYFINVKGVDSVKVMKVLKF